MIINLTQHAVTPEQLAAGVIDMEKEIDRAFLSKLLTFEELPDQAEMRLRARAITVLAVVSAPACDTAMIGGAPWLMAPLERALRQASITPVYAFSVRESTEQVQPDGSARKVARFRHAGFVPAQETEK